MRLYVVRICVCLTLLMAVGQVVIGEVEIQDNGYQGLTIAIHKNVKENPELLTTLKEILKRSSKLLYDATKKRAYFKDATIIVPSTWSSKPEYVTDESDECLRCAEIRIAPPTPQNGNIPYTYQPGGCGERGQFIHFTPDFIVNSLSRNQRKPLNGGCQDCGKKSKIFVHEWVHLRYGVFDEAGDKGPFQKFYKSNKNTVEVTGCATNLYGYLQSNSNTTKQCRIDRYGNVDDCTFIPDMNLGVNKKSKVSLMYLPEIESEFTGFCSDDDDHGNGLKHNSAAPNQQNRMCTGRSVMNVILDNKDFKNGRNPQRQIANLEPKITVLQKIKRKNGSIAPYIFVLDASTSMMGRPIEYLHVAVTRFLRHNAREKCPIGMVSFEIQSEVLAPVTAINDQTRETLIQKMPKKLKPGTAIGQGILEAIGMLRLPNGKIQKGNIVLISDGEQNIRPLVENITDQIKESGVTIYSVAFGLKASSKLEDLTTLTGGKGWQFKLDEVSRSLDSSLNEIGLTCGEEVEEDMKPFINKNGAFKLDGGKKIEGMFRIDKDQGITPEVTILFSYDSMDNKGNGNVPEVRLISPSGDMYTPANKECIVDKNSHTIRCRFKDAKDGNWTYEIENGPDPVTMNLMITSDIVYEKNIPFDFRPVRVDSWISAGKVNFPQVPKIFAKVEEGFKPVLRAKVLSTLYRPNGDSTTIQLFDNGQDPDTNANDGTYTAYITQYKGSGRYAIDTVVVNDGDARLANVAPGSKASILPEIPEGDHFGESKLHFDESDFKKVDYDIKTDEEPDYDSMVPVGPFERFANAGTFVLDNWEADKDLIPPSQVRDLTATVIDLNTRTVRLQWISPGDDMNDGKATKAEIRYHQDPSFLIQSYGEAFDNVTILNGSLEPPEPHEKHSLILQLPLQEPLEIYFAVRLYDEAGNVGMVSNIAYANFVPSPATTTKQTPTTTSKTTAAPSSAEGFTKQWTGYLVIGGFVPIWLSAYLDRF